MQQKARYLSLSEVMRYGCFAERHRDWGLDAPFASPDRLSSFFSFGGSLQLLARFLPSQVTALLGWLCFLYTNGPMGMLLLRLPLLLCKSGSLGWSWSISFVFRGCKDVFMV